MNSVKNSVPLNTECVGRLLIDLPVDGFRNWTQNFDRADVTKISSSSRESFWTDVNLRKKELENSPHSNETHLLSEFIKVDDNSALVIYREDEAVRHGYKMERFLWLDDYGYRFEGDIANDEKKQLEIFIPVLSKIVSRSNESIPNIPGFCIDGAMITGDVGYITAGPSVEVSGLKQTFLWLGAGEGVQPFPISDGEDHSSDADLDRERKAIRETVAEYPEAPQDPSYPKDFDVLRQENRALDGFAGREVVWRKRLNNGAVIYTFRWETTGKSSVTQHPDIAIGMDVGKNEYPIQQVPTEEKLFALWDAVLESLKPRPGAR